ncbi:MAG: mechanosensitive ion channel protein MscS [Verrucomicrobiales bacterium]|nr:mechanosensitive ion channel protein MscS [Verrucomicrobiales bacterium]|tara:strand:+ start:253 stop:1140 length:888 start_codon:yes stop_codon:yes gene_type:complete
MNETLQSVWNFIIEIWGTELFGDGTVTIGGILMVIILFVLVVIIERFLQRLIIRRFLSKTRLHSSLQYGLSRILGYILLAVGFYIAFQIAGFDLSSLAIIAASLGVGVGFGLQNIINNFVSGIIILAERPIAIGDRIEVAGIAGRVTKIQLRSTTVVTNDNITMIVPNADFISNTVTNWSHGDPKVRIRVPVGVAYATDLKLLQNLLLEAALEHPKALRDPKPVVLFTEFGDNSLNFELAVWTQEMTATPIHFTSEMNFIIEEKLRENGIEIPFPQRDLHVRSGLPHSVSEQDKI